VCRVVDAFSETRHHDDTRPRGASQLRSPTACLDRRLAVADDRDPRPIGEGDVANNVDLRELEQRPLVTPMRSEPIVTTSAWFGGTYSSTCFGFMSNTRDPCRPV